MQKKNIFNKMQSEKEIVFRYLMLKLALYLTYFIYVRILIIRSILN
jgi:hypothetical protein